MRSRNARAISVVICSLVIAILFSGCKKDINALGSDASSTNDRKPFKITMVNRAGENFILEDNPIIKNIEEKANVKLEIEIPPINDYENRLNILMASGELPDLINIIGMDAKYQKYAENGLIIPIDDYLKNTPNIMKRIQPSQLEQARVEKTGKLHSIPRPHENSTFIALYRKDWLDTLGLKAPQTISEFEKVAIAIAKQDPDKNGKADTYAYSLIPGSETSAIFDGAFGLRAGLVPDENGKVTIFEAQEAYIRQIDFLRKLYSERAIDPEWYLNKDYGDREKFKLGRLGIISRTIKPIELVTSVTTDTIKAFPQAKVDYFLPLKNDSGKSIAYLTPSVWTTFAISKDAKDPKRIMEFVDWSFSDEGIEAWTAGVKGVTYESFDIKTGICKIPDSMIEARTKFTSGHLGFITSENGKRLMIMGNTDAERNTVSKATEDYYRQVEIINSPSTNILQGQALSATSLNDINNTKNRYVRMYILGEISKDEFTNYINEKYVTANKPLIDALQKYYDEKLKK